MKKVLLVFANYKDRRQEFFDTYISPRNQKYADIHGFEYLEIRGPLKKYRDNFTWLKFSIPKKLIADGYLSDGDILVHLDADMCIVKTDQLFPTNKSFSYSIDSGNTHCMGAYSLKINEWSREMLDNILSEKRYKHYKDKIYYHPNVPIYTFWSWFREQASWYSLAGIIPHSDKSFWDLENFGWHSLTDELTQYGLDDLSEHVEVLPTSWNVTEMAGESSCHYFINKVDREDVIIRHFAGGQPWRKEWFEI